MKTTRHIFIAFALVATASAHADTFTWSGDALLGSQWSRDNNWTTSAPPSNGTAALIFTGSDRLDAEADMSWSIRSITFDAIPGVSGFSIQGSTLTIGSGGITNNDSKFQFISNNIVLAAAQTWSASAGSIQSNGSVNTSGHLLTLDSTIGQRVSVNNAITGTGGVTLNGGGQLFFSGGSANTYTGVTTVNNGQLTLEKTAGVTAVAGSLVIGDGVAAAKVFVPAANQIANTSDVTINGGAVLDVREQETIDALTINGGSVIVLFATSSLTASSLTMTGGSLGANDPGRFILNGNLATNTSSAIANINAILDLNAGVRTLNVANGAAAVDLQSAGSITNGGLIKTGAGTLRMIGGAANNYTGSTTVNAGTLELSKTAGQAAIGGPLHIGDGIGVDTVRLLADEQIANTTGVTIQGGVLDLNGFNETIAALTMEGGSVDTGAGALTLGGDVTASVGGAVVPTVNGNLNLGNPTRTFIVNDAPTAPIDLNVAAVVSSTFGTTGIIKEGAGTLLLGGANTFTGGLTVNAGEVAINSSTAAGTGTLTLNAGAISAAGAARTLANAVTLGGNITIGGSLDLTFTGPATLTGNRTLTVSNSGLTTFSRIAQDAAGRSLTKTGAGTLVFSSAVPNTYTGVTTVNAGELRLGKTAGANAIAGPLIIGDGAGTDVVRLLAGNQIADASSVTINAGGEFQLDGFSETIAALTLNGGSVLDAMGTGVLTLGGDVTVGGAGGSQISSAINLGSPIRTFTVADAVPAGTSLTLNQTISNGGIIKTGAGTMLLSAVNTYIIATNVSQGKLISSGSLAASSSVNVANGATFEVVNPQSVKALVVASGGLAVLSSTTPTFLTTNSLSLTGTAALDMNQRAMAINYQPGQSPFNTVRASIISGYAGGLWTGPGIRSSTAAANTALAVGYAEASDVLGPSGGTFLGQSIDGDTVLIRTTLAGDATLNGTVDFQDLVNLAQSYDIVDGSRTWFTGDFTNDGNTDFADLVKLAQNYNTALPIPPVAGDSASFEHDVATAFASVPEPSSLAWCAVGAWALVKPTRRRSDRLI